MASRLGFPGAKYPVDGVFARAGKSEGKRAAQEGKGELITSGQEKPGLEVHQ
jgi:hypothetical protein